MSKENKKDKRYQECNILEKTWRRRHYLKIPFKWIWWKISSNKGFTNGGYWKILIGSAQIDMRWYYTQEEVIKFFDTKIIRNNKIERDEDTLHS
jgi:hypothetical protein